MANQAVVIREQELRIAELTRLNDDLEAKLHQASREKKTLESDLQRKTTAAQSLETRLQKAKEGEKSAIVKASQAEGLASKTVAAKVEAVRQELQQEKDNEIQSIRSEAAMQIATAEARADEAAASHASSGVESARALQNIFALELECISGRDAIQSAATEEYVALLQGHCHFLQRCADAHETRAELIHANSTMASKITELEEDQYTRLVSEVPTLRQALLDMEREKAALQREVSVLDKSLVEMEVALRGVYRQKTESDNMREELATRCEGLARSLADVTTNDTSQEISSAMEVNELRAEVHRLQAKLHSAKTERREALAAAKKMKMEVRQAKERLDQLYDDGERARELMASELTQLRWQRQRVDESLQHDADTLRQQWEGKVRQLTQRVKDLETTVQHKDHSLTVAQEQITRLSAAGATSPRPGNSTPRDPYGKGMRFSRVASPMRSPGAYLL